MNRLILLRAWAILGEYCVSAIEFIGVRVCPAVAMAWPVMFGLKVWWSIQNFTTSRAFEWPTEPPGTLLVNHVVEPGNSIYGIFPWFWDFDLWDWFWVSAAALAFMGIGDWIYVDHLLPWVERSKTRANTFSEISAADPELVGPQKYHRIGFEEGIRRLAILSGALLSLPVLLLASLPVLIQMCGPAELQIDWTAGQWFYVYAVILAITVVAYSLGWGAVRVIGWVIAGFRSRPTQPKPRGKEL